MTEGLQCLINALFNFTNNVLTGLSVYIYIFFFKYAVYVKNIREALKHTVPLLTYRHFSQRVSITKGLLVS